MSNLYLVIDSDEVVSYKDLTVEELDKIYNEGQVIVNLNDMSFSTEKDKWFSIQLFDSLNKRDSDLDI